MKRILESLVALFGGIIIWRDESLLGQLIDNKELLKKISDHELEIRKLQGWIGL